ncbi:type III secretion system export apparatus subunit SctU [Belnapia sp. T18]|uniref:Type III secretion system export apparatus subunit SctU n=1 Tax=Belnapia arida TaxID=2804533 RepID=A0ABS1U5V2_9PROT|nr:type III secretion system export apparatus subunit SctU [Belnapia arida]MBL6080028.1 type III secretion system export apparatus subunit SctU [Belnapia arida]
MSEKTEQPTAKRLRDARKKGEVPFSKELSSSLLILLFFTLLAVTLPGMTQRMQIMLTMPLPFLDMPPSIAADRVLHGLLEQMVTLLLPFLLICVVGGAAGSLLQFGLLLSGEHAKPSLKKLNPAQYFKKTFGLQNLVEFGKSLLKIAVLSAIVWHIVTGGMQALVYLPACGLDCLRRYVGDMLYLLMVWAAAPFIIIAAADFAYQRYSFTKKHKMSKDEVKREYKESEGDPQVKGMRKQLHQQMLAEGKIDRARKATMLVTNPTHVAVAVVYEEQTTPLPVVTAMGTDLVARRMIEAAHAAGVPVMQDVPLARALLEQAMVEQYIPSDLIEPFAEVLRALQSLSRE